jgi:hypothetical protein
MSEFYVPDDFKYDVPDQEGCFVVPVTTRIERPGITWAYARADDRIVAERTPSPPLQRAPEQRTFERYPEQLEFQGGTP